jgi:hypothetical protein
MHFFLLHVINAMYIQWVTDVIVPSLQNTMQVDPHSHLLLSYFEVGNPS